MKWTEKLKFCTFSGSQISLRFYGLYQGCEKIHSFFEQLSLINFEVECHTSPFGIEWICKSSTVEDFKSYRNLLSEKVVKHFSCKYVASGGLSSNTSLDSYCCVIGVQPLDNSFASPATMSSMVGSIRIFLFHNGQPISGNAILREFDGKVQEALNWVKWENYKMKLKICGAWEQIDQYTVASAYRGSSVVHVVIYISSADGSIKPKKTREVIKKALKDLERSYDLSEILVNKRHLIGLYVPSVAASFQSIIARSTNDAFRRACLECLGAESTDQIPAKFQQAVSSLFLSPPSAHLSVSSTAGPSISTYSSSTSAPAPSAPSSPSAFSAPSTLSAFPLPLSSASPPTLFSAFCESLECSPPATPSLFLPTPIDYLPD